MQNILLDGIPFVSTMVSGSPVEEEIIYENRNSVQGHFVNSGWLDINHYTSWVDGKGKRYAAWQC